MAVVVLVDESSHDIRQLGEVPFITNNYPPRGWELIDGRPAEMIQPCGRASFVRSELIQIVGRYLQDAKLGIALGSLATYACFPDRPRHVRRPHASVFPCDIETFIPPRYNSLRPPAIVMEFPSSDDRKKTQHNNRERVFHRRDRVGLDR